MTKLKVKVTVYKQQLCIETVDLKNTDDDFVPCGDGRIGCVLINIAEFESISSANIFVFPTST